MAAARSSSSNQSTLKGGRLAPIDVGSPTVVSSHLADRRPAPIQASGTPRAMAAVSLLDLFHPTPQQGKLAQRRLEAMRLTGPQAGGGGLSSTSSSAYGGNGDHAFDDEAEFEEEEEEEETAGEAAAGTAATDAVAGVGAGAAAGGGGEQGGQQLQQQQPQDQKKKKKKKKRLKHKLRKLYYYYSGTGPGGKVDLKNPEARANTAGALSQLIAGNRQKQQQQQFAGAGAAGAGSAGAGHVAIPMEG